MSKGLIGMNVNDAWKNFTQSGSVPDYLRYVQAQRDSQTDTEEQDEIQDQRTDSQTAEYR